MMEWWARRGRRLGNLLVLIALVAVLIGALALGPVGVLPHWCLYLASLLVAVAFCGTLYVRERLLKELRKDRRPRTTWGHPDA